MLRMSVVDGWLDVGGLEVRNVGVTAPSCRMLWFMDFRNGVNAVSGQGPVSTPSSFQALTVCRLAGGR
jgi:hypothetical protein